MHTSTGTPSQCLKAGATTDTWEKTEEMYKSQLHTRQKARLQITHENLEAYHKLLTNKDKVGINYFQYTGSVIGS